MATMTAPALNVQRGIVKQVLSGDALIIRGQPKGGPPPERVIGLSNITAPRLARRANPASTVGITEVTPDEAFAWEAREYLRKKLIGKEVSFTVEYKAPGTGKEYGVVYLGKDTSAENITESLIAEGLVEVRRSGLKLTDEGQNRLAQLEDAAKAAGKGKWTDDKEQDKHKRTITWTLESPRNYVDFHKQKPVDAVIEHVRDGCTVRVFVLGQPTYEHITVMLSGIKCPMYKLEGTEQIPEPFADQAKYFTECRLLQRDVQIRFEGVSNQNLLGTIIHPAGNIAELLLREGFARCVNWSMGVVYEGAGELRAAEKFAKEKKLRQWKDYTPTETIEIKDKNFTARVVEVGNGDSLTVKLADDSYKKIFLASVRPPRMPQDAAAETKKIRPLYDVPYMYEAREFLRKRLVGKKVNVQVDYIQKANQGFPEKTCCTVTIGGINVAETLISKGLATVIKYSINDDLRSAFYDELLAAENRAAKYVLKLHSKKDAPIHRVADIAGDVPKAKQFLPFLQRAGKSQAIVEYIASGSRCRLYLPRETCLITFLLSGIECPRGSRPAPGGATIPAEPCGEAATLFTKEMCMQREVEVEVEAIDRGGNFIGWMFVDDSNMSVSLVKEGLAKVHFTAEKTPHYRALCNAEEEAKTSKKNLWENFEEPKEVEVKEEVTERKVNQKSVVITEVKSDGHFYGQYIDDGPQLEKLMDDLRVDFETNPPLAGAYQAKRGDLCAAKFSDGQWYRAKVEKVSGGNVHALYMDYGNREVTDNTKLASLPPAFVGLAPQAHEFFMACINLPSEEDAKLDAVYAIEKEVLDKQFLVNVEYKNAGVEYVTLSHSETKDDIAEKLVSEGLLLVENRREKRLHKLVSGYKEAQDKAKGQRLNLWCYGDFTEDDAKEFGYAG